MRLLDISKAIKKPGSALSYLAREGRFKTAHKIREDHRDVWYVSDDEGNLFIKEYLLNIK